MNDKRRRQFGFEDKVLDLIELQLQNDENSLSQTDLQGAVGALVSRIMNEGKRIVIDHGVYKKRIHEVANAMAEMDSNSPEAFEIFLNHMLELGVTKHSGIFEGHDDTTSLNRVSGPSLRSDETNGDPMYYHDKRLQYPVRVENPDPLFARQL